MNPYRTPFRRWAWLPVLFLAVCPEVRPQTAGDAVHFALKNGLEVILSEDANLPIVSVAVAYRVGSADDPPAKSGLAYLMETLMFSGSANVAPLQHINTMYRIGGNFNASVTEDRTVFFQTVPSHYLGLVLWLESDRMRSLEITPESFEMARNDHLIELRRKRLEEPYLESRMVFDQAVFPGSSFHQPLEGTEMSLTNLSVQDARSFYTEDYVPNRAVLSVAGQFDRVRARELIARYFETIPRGSDIPPASPPPTVPETKAFTRTLADPIATSPAFFWGYRIGIPTAAERRALRLLEYVLIRGASSRLLRRLLGRNNKIAYQVNGGLDIRGDQVAFRVFGVVGTASMLDVCLNAATNEIDRLKRTSVPDDELLRAKRAFQSDRLDSLATPTDRALTLAKAFLSMPDFAAYPKEMEQVLDLTAYDLRVVVNRYFGPDKMFIVKAVTK
jgi:zinc protease